MPDNNDILGLIVDRLRTAHSCHTVILYGSRARGDADATSDYDVLGIHNGKGDVIRDTGLWMGTYLDLFIYPRDKLANPQDFMQARGGKVLYETDVYGTNLLQALEEVYARGPEKLSSNEVEARRVWAFKMLERAGRGDIESNYRRVWLMTAILEDYFTCRQRWYEGPKTSFKWLNDHEPELLALFKAALHPGAAQSALETLVEAVTERYPAENVQPSLSRQPARC